MDGGSEAQCDNARFTCDKIADILKKEGVAVEPFV